MRLVFIFQMGGDGEEHDTERYMKHTCLIHPSRWVPLECVHFALRSEADSWFTHDAEPVWRDYRVPGLLQASTTTYCRIVLSLTFQSQLDLVEWDLNTHGLMPSVSHFKMKEPIKALKKMLVIKKPL
jgi:hypothetical protein